MDYQAGSFSDVYNTELGKDVWDYLNDDRIKSKMQLATDLGFPAVEGVGNDLFYKFPSVYRNDRYKQMIGHMIKQIMESLGYSHYKKNIKCTKQRLYSNGSVYQKIDSKVEYKGKIIEPVPLPLANGEWNTEVNVLEFKPNELELTHYFEQGTWATRIEAIAASIQLGRRIIDQSMKQ